MSNLKYICCMSFVANTFASFKEIAEKAINDIQNSWTDPFEEPIVLFSSPYVKKWFTKYWVQKEGVVANVESPNLESFAWQVLVTDPNEKIRQLRPEMLQQILLAKLPEYKLIKEQADDYSARLVDLADGVTAKFREYELAFGNSLIESWLNDKPFFAEINKESEGDIEKWQRNLYREIFTGNGCECGIKVDDTEYVSIPQLYYKLTKENNWDEVQKRLKESLGGKYIYLIGQFSVGQFYLDLFEKVKNVAHISWLKVEERKNDAVDVAQKKIEIVAAPSRMREIEELYQKVWRDIKQGGARLDEMLVLIPNVDGYRTAIERVFPKYASPQFPYAFANPSEKDSLVARGITTLLDMASAKDISRTNFLAFVRNPLVQNSLNIDSEVCDSFEQWITEANIYRNEVKINKVNEWSFGVKRLLLSRLTGNAVTLNDDEPQYLPFENMTSADDSNLEIFCQLIDDLNAFIADRDVFIEEENINGNVQKYHYWKNLDYVRKWLNPGYQKSLEEEKGAYAGLIHTVNSLGWQHLIVGRDPSFAEIKFAILNSLKGIETQCGKFLQDGLTFAKFTTEAFIPVKYLYLVGMNFEDFPGDKEDSTLDLRGVINDEKLKEKALPDKVMQKKDAFWQEIRENENIYVSYLCKDLKENAALYPAGVVKELIGKIGGNKTELNIDEANADGHYLWRRAYRHEVDAALAKAKPSFKSKLNNLPVIDPPKDEAELTKDLISFLKNPFEFQISKVLKIYEKEDAGLNNFEPIELDSIQRASWNRELFGELVNDIYDSVKTKSDFKTEHSKKKDDLVKKQNEMKHETKTTQHLRTLQDADEQLRKISAEYRSICKEIEDEKNAKYDIPNIVENAITKSSVWKKQVASQFNGSIPQNVNLQNRIKQDLASLIIAQILIMKKKGLNRELVLSMTLEDSCYKAVAPNNMIYFIDVRNTAKYEHLIRLYINVLQKVNKNGISAKFKLLVVGKDSFIKSSEINLSKDQTEQILEKITHHAYGKKNENGKVITNRLASLIPCEICGKLNEDFTIDDFMEECQKDEYGIWSYPSSASKLFSEEDWGIPQDGNMKFEDWENWQIYKSLIENLLPPKKDDMHNSGEDVDNA